MPLNPLYFVPILAANRHHQSNDNCLQGKREIIRSAVCSVMCNSCTQCRIKGLLGVLEHPGPQFRLPAIGGSGKFLCAVIGL